MALGDISPIRGVRTNVVRTKTPTVSFDNSSPKESTSETSPRKKCGESKFL